MSEPKPKAPGKNYGELSPKGEWYWDGTGKPDDTWLKVEPKKEVAPKEEVAPAEVPVQTAAISSFAITVLLSGSMTNPINSQTFQLVAPWGKTSACTSLYDAVNQCFLGKGGSLHGGRMGAYFMSQALNGASGSGPTGYLNANEN